LRVAAMLRGTGREPPHAGILVVDDDPCMRELLRLHLSNAGYGVRTAEDAIVAGHMLLEAVPRLMIVDVNMPYMTGLEFVAAVRADATLPEIPVIFLTSDEGSFARGLSLGASAYLLKPVRADRLLALVAEQISIPVAA